MLIVIICLLLLILPPILVTVFYNEDFYCIYFIGVPLSIIITVCFLTGMYDYPYLITQREQCLSVQSEIVSIKNAYYKEATNGTLVGGSLDNVKQSTNLSDYIKLYAKHKAEYNGELKSVQEKMKLPIYQFFGYRFFRSEKILDMQPIN